MIRINLLPVRQVKRREAGRQYLVASAVLLLVVFLGNGYAYFAVSAEKDKVERRLADLKNRINQLQKVIGEVNNLKQRKQQVEEKLKVLDSLKKKRGGPVKLLDALATAIPKKVYILDFKEKNSELSMTGNADSLESVSEFMKGLQAVVWTPKGMGRVVDTRQSSSRVELLEQGTIEDFPPAEIGHFFTQLDLKNSTLVKDGKTDQDVVKFELVMGVDYAI